MPELSYNITGFATSRGFATTAPLLRVSALEIPNQQDQRRQRHRNDQQTNNLHGFAHGCPG